MRLFDNEMAGAGGSLPPMIVDSFAGGGGASTGIEIALGRSPDIAINHNEAALALHEANHPETLHVSQNIYHVDPLDYVYGRHVGLAWFSPDCKHFSKAKGGKPVERNIRDLAWIVVLWAERAQPDVIILENVEEFQDWGPLVETERGLMPCPKRRGATFEKWCRALQRQGYKIQHRQLRACDYGAPTIRRRLFLIARRDGKPIVWPEPTHGAPDDPDVLAGRKLPWRTAADDVIDFSKPCPSIFDTSDEIMEKHGLRAVRPLKPATMARVARGVKRYVLEAERPFLVSVAHGDSGGRREYPLDEPFGVVTAGGISHALVAPTMVQTGYGERKGQAPRALDIDAPLGTVVAGGVKHALVATFVAHHNNDRRREGGVNPGRSAAEPISTITAHPQQGVIAAHLMSLKGSSRRDRGVDAPHPAVLAGGGHSAVIAPHIMTMRNSGKPFNGADEPTHTVTAGGAGLSMVAPFMQKYYGTGDGQRVDEPAHTVTVKDRFGYVEAGMHVPPFTEAQAERAREVAGFLRAHGFWDEREFVTLEIDGAEFVIVDIGMRMLGPRELFNAQGFPREYRIDIDFNGRPLPKNAQVSCCGNSVCPPLAAALVGANCAHLAVERMAAE
ncbi:DNA cytosine methyltransferase [Nitratireductor sp. OM-1]|uniref:DNA cytosine methyltransferase n=1 Tax=Nitratireductor sp. OM-1 TaxID=1756988 RepID=UPI000DDCF333|nr:DNA cytosine methyltransferase [Nitratireductor sp. OM-1]